MISLLSTVPLSISNSAHISKSVLTTEGRFLIDKIAANNGKAGGLGVLTIQAKALIETIVDRISSDDFNFVTYSKIDSEY
jgi:hypothetical protein